MNRDYDFVCSLGGNCAAAHNLLYRGLRFCALPFDWLFIKDETPILKLAECFENNFKNFALKENMIPLSKEEYSEAHSDKFQYKDKYSQFYFVNHFDKSIEDGGYKIFRQKLDRRLKRFYEIIEKSENILFLLSVDFESDFLSIQNLKSVLEKKFPQKTFNFEILEFGCKEDNIIDKNGITLRKFKRNMNNYDFVQTNFEWEFLDRIRVSKIIKAKFTKLFFVKRLKRGFEISILPQLFTMITLKLYFLGLRFRICLGRDRI